MQSFYFFCTFIADINQQRDSHMFRKIVIASDSFKGCISSTDVADAAESAIREIFPECTCTKVSIADGGEGTMESLCGALGAEVVSIKAADPLMRRIDVSYGVKDRTAIIEMSKASGLPLLSTKERNPLLTTTYGTGEMLRDALDRGCTKILVGIGGSATNDAGIGMLSAMGAEFYDKDGESLPGIGASLGKIETIGIEGIDPRIFSAEITVACDVDTPFCGPDGAAYVFAPQKGATPEQVESLDKGMEHFADIIEKQSGQPFRTISGTGAAGGLGGAFLSILGARLQSGIDMVLDAVKFNETIMDADLVITGEGKMDFQTPKGKTAAGVLQRAKAAGVPVLALAGKVDMCPELEGMGFQKILEVSKGLPLEIAMNPDIAKGNIKKAVSDYLLK